MCADHRKPKATDTSSARGPETERAYPPTPENPGYLESAARIADETLPPTASVPAPARLAADFHDTLKDNPSVQDEENLAATAPSNLHTMRSIPQAAAAAPKESNATLQSMKRPEEAPGGVPHSRRFLRIENDLDQARVNIKLLRKELHKAQREARFAWIVALCAAAMAGAALAL